MDRRFDLRVKRTRSAIKNAFLELLSEKPFDNISVIDIAERAMINRSTFYLHYQDKYDLLKTLENENLKIMSYYSEMITEESVNESIQKGLPFPHLVPLLTYLKANPYFFKNVIKSEIGLEFYNKIGKRFSNKIFLLLGDFIADDIIKKYDEDIAISIVSSIISKWIDTDMEDSPEEIATLITNSIRAIINKYA